MFIRCLAFALILHSASQQDVKHLLPKPMIGAYFDRNTTLEQAFSLAVNLINKCLYDHEICETIQPSGMDTNVHLFHQVEFSAMAIHTDNDMRNLYKKFGELAGINDEQDTTLTAWSDNDYGISVVMGPHHRIPSLYIQGLCEIHDIPHIVIRRELEKEHNPLQSINLYPDTETLATIYIQMIKKLNWTNFSILYERSENFIALDNILTMYPFYSYNVYAYKLGRGPNFSDTLLKVRDSAHKHFLIDCGYDILGAVLKQAQIVGMMTEDYKYVITTLDMHALDLRPYQYSGVNISGLQLVDVHNPFVRKLVGSHLDDFGISSVEKLQVKDALMFDAVFMFAQAFKDLNYKYRILRGAMLNKEYNNPMNHPWNEGLSLRNYMLYTQINGLTGPLMIDGDGVRRRFKLDVVNLHQTGLQKVGEWNPDEGFEDLNLLSNNYRPHYKVLITLNPPYAMKVNHSRSLDGNSRYEGFVIDLIAAIAEEMKFDYTFYVQEDSDNGKCEKSDKTGVCNCTGMMGKLLSHEMDMAITDLTVTENRAICVQFSTSFMNLGLSILFKKPQKAEATWYSFFKPFSYQVWLYLALTYVGVSILFFVYGRSSAAEWTNPFPCIDEPTELHNQFTISNAFWFTLGAIMQQGSEIAPIGYSTRTLAGVWWFFCLIIVNTYIANLAASLSVETPVKLIKGIEDLYDQTEIKFGAKASGSTFTYFASSEDIKHKKLYARMNEDEWKSKYVVDTNEKGIEMVKRKDINYAFFMESSSIDYIVQRECDLEQAGDYIGHKYYAIAYAKNFSSHHQLSRTVSILQESLVIKDLKSKWWDMKGATCGKADPNSPEPMTLEQLKGVFYVLGTGLFFALLLTAYEFTQYIRSITKTDGSDFMETAKMELKIMMQSKSVRPVIRKKPSKWSDSFTHDLTMTALQSLELF